MEQNPPSNQAILAWLADYTYFICARFSLPHEQANGLLQQYLNLTTFTPPHQSATSPYQQPTSYPEPPNPQQSTHFGEQLPSAHLATHFQHTPLSHPVAPSPYHESNTSQEADHALNTAGIITPNALPQGPFSPYGLQLDNMMTVDEDSPQRSAPSPQSIEPPNEPAIGSIKDYDPLWVQHNNVDPAAVENLQSSMKFDTLFTNGVIKIGDILTFQVLFNTNGQDIKTEAHLEVGRRPLLVGRSSCSPNQVIGSSKSPSPLSKFPDLSVTLLSDPSRQYPPAKTCGGTKAMIEHLETTCNMQVIKPAWRDIQVFRGQQALGDLWWVKQAFHLWRDRKDQEAQETGRFFRTRRPRREKGASGVVVHRKGRMGVFQGGVFVPDPDQARFRPAG